MQFEQTVYTKVGSDEIGIVPSDEGPQLTINCEVYPLRERCWDLEMVIGKSHFICTIYWKGEVKLSVRLDRGHDFFLKLFGYLQERLAQPHLV
ncbi:hypothetical protein [Paenibacillus hamazuiensis]|uniref:hypothetical protein n=1 Tax=Paenibacillus hamazuiensis TaxID=2936508 RepID=UPI00200D93BA|nr:hypothetical protein [Paenibacillus hamazuiensis]